MKKNVLLSDSKLNAPTFDEWFDALSPEEQEEYWKDLEADYWIESQKSE